MAEVELQVDPRAVLGKKVKALRRQGLLPLHLYGRGIESLSLQAPKQAVQHLLRTTGRNVIIDLHINGEGKPRPAVLRAIQRNPVTGDLLHIDFFQVSLTEKLRAEVPLVLVGEAPAVSVYGGILLQSLGHITVEALPTDVPPHIEVDVSGLAELESGLHVRDLAVPLQVAVLSDPELVVAKVAAPRLAAEREEEAVPEEVPAEEAPAEEAPAEAEAGRGGGARGGAGGGGPG